MGATVHGAMSTGSRAGRNSLDRIGELAVSPGPTSNRFTAGRGSSSSLPIRNLERERIEARVGKETPLAERHTFILVSDFFYTSVLDKVLKVHEANLCAEVLVIVSITYGYTTNNFLISFQRQSLCNAVINFPVSRPDLPRRS